MFNKEPIYNVYASYLSESQLFVVNKYIVPIFLSSPVAFSTKPKHLPVAPYTDRTREGKRKGKGKKRNPCLRKYKDFCIHGVCQYLRELREPSCMWAPSPHSAPYLYFVRHLSCVCVSPNSSHCLLYFFVDVCLDTLVSGVTFSACQWQRKQKATTGQ